MSAPDLSFKIPSAREGLSFGPAKALVMSLSRSLPTAQSSALLGDAFQQQAISQIIGEVQDALEAYAKMERELR